MQCARCAGMNVPEVILAGGARIFAMRCVHCGDIIDHVILMNRRRQLSIRLRTSIYGRNRSTWNRSAPINMRRADLECTRHAAAQAKEDRAESDKIDGDVAS
jgi:hypothetical protein